MPTAIIDKSATIDIVNYLSTGALETIIKRDVTAVVVVGGNVIIKSTSATGRPQTVKLIPSQINSPTTYANANELQNYISTILGTYTLPITVENSDLSYTALATTNPFVLPDTTYNILKNSVLDSTFTNPTLDPVLDINIS